MRSANLTAALPVTALNAAAGALETVRGGRPLHTFTLSTAALPLCTSGSGACVVWEASSGSVVFDERLAERIAAARDVPAVAARFVQELLTQLHTGGSHASADKPHARAAPHHSVPPTTEEKECQRHGHASGGMGAAEMGQRMASAATAALAAMAAGSIPLWWCVLCPIALGMLAPLIFNLGLTAAAEQLCNALKLQPQECTDLW